MLDRAAFRRAHPEARYVQYSKRELARLHAEGYSSQYGQDHYLWTEVLRGQTPGFFVDIGGNDPVELSNSYHLEQNGWRGVAFDPLSRAESLWRESRSAEFHRVAISDERSERSFVEFFPLTGWEHTLSGFAGYVRDEDMRMYEHAEYLVTTAPLADFLPDGTSIDVLMIDVEGAEELVVRGVDLLRTRPRYVMVENVSAVGGGKNIRALITAAGYDVVARIGGADDLFRRRDAAGA
jgi:FkbM family methyltransferase